MSERFLLQNQTESVMAPFEGLFEPFDKMSHSCESKRLLFSFRCF
jgi:hypothetical protein